MIFNVRYVMAHKSDEVRPEKGYEHHHRVAVDELFGRMAEKGFEDFTKAERGIWANLKTRVLEAINKFLGSLKLPKWVNTSDSITRNKRQKILRTAVFCGLTKT